VIDAAAIGTRVRAPVARAEALESGRRAVATTAVAVAMLPLLVPRGPANLGPIDVLMGISVFACLCWAGATGHRWRFPYAIPVFLFVAAGGLGALFGPVPIAGSVAIIQDIFLLAWCWALVNICHSSGRLRLVLTTWVYSSIVWASLLFLGLATGSSFLTGRSSGEGTRTALTFLDPNVSANYYFISIMMIWASRCPRQRGFRVAAYALLVAALITTGSNSGIVSVMVGVAVAAILGVYRRSGTPAAVTALAFCAIGGYFLASTVSVSHIQERASASRYAFIRDGIGRGASSVTNRSTLLQESVPLFKNGGPLGQGPVSTKPRLKGDMAPLAKEAHDDYLAALLERGAVGFVALLLLLAAIGARAFSLIGGRLRQSFAAVMTKPNALVGAFAGTIVAGTAYEFLHLRHVWTLFALIAAFHTWGRE
jgi:O-antigen ligase